MIQDKEYWKLRTLIFILVVISCFFNTDYTDAQNTSQKRFFDGQNYLLHPFYYQDENKERDSVSTIMTKCFQNQLIRLSQMGKFKVSFMLEEVNEMAEIIDYVTKSTGIGEKRIIMDTANVIVTGHISVNDNTHILDFKLVVVDYVSYDGVKLLSTPNFLEGDNYIYFRNDELDRNSICNSVQAYFRNLDVGTMIASVFQAKDFDPNQTPLPYLSPTKIPNPSNPSINYQNVDIYLSDMRECDSYNIFGLSYPSSAEVFKLWFSDYFSLYKKDPYAHLLYFKLEECVEALSGEGFDNSLNSNPYENITTIDNQLKYKFKLFGQSDYVGWAETYPEIARNKTVYYKTVRPNTDDNLNVWITNKVKEFGKLKKESIDKMAYFMSDYCDRIFLPNNWTSYSEKSKIDWLENNVKKFKQCKYDKFRY